MMYFKNTEQRYGIITKLLHWSIAILFIVQFYLIYWKRYMLPEGSPLVKFYMVGLHKPLGVVLLALGIFAVVWKLLNKKPTFPNSMPKWEIFSAGLVHFFLYLSIVLMPLTGLLMSVAAARPISFFNLFTIPSLAKKNQSLTVFFYNAHEILSFVIMALFIVHVAAALKHHFIEKDNILKRMF